MILNGLLVAAGGMIGALSRWGLGHAIKTMWPMSFPVSTLFVNILGCFLIGLYAGGVSEIEQYSKPWTLFFMIGILGSLTTFSTFGLECVQLIQAKKWLSLFAYWGMSNVGGVLMVLLGFFLRR